MAPVHERVSAAEWQAYLCSAYPVGAGYMKTERDDGDLRDVGTYGYEVLEYCEVARAGAKARSVVATVTSLEA